GGGGRGGGGRGGGGGWGGGGGAGGGGPPAKNCPIPSRAAAAAKRPGMALLLPRELGGTTLDSGVFAGDHNAGGPDDSTALGGDRRLRRVVPGLLRLLHENDDPAAVRGDREQRRLPDLRPGGPPLPHRPPPRDPASVERSAAAADALADPARERRLDREHLRGVADPADDPSPISRRARSLPARRRGEPHVHGSRGDGPPRGARRGRPAGAASRGDRPLRTRERPHGDGGLRDRGRGRRDPRRESPPALLPEPGVRLLPRPPRHRTAPREPAPPRSALPYSSSPGYRVIRSGRSGPR